MSLFFLPNRPKLRCQPGGDVVVVITNMPSRMPKTRQPAWSGTVACGRASPTSWLCVPCVPCVRACVRACCTCAALVLLLYTGAARVHAAPRGTSTFCAGHSRQWAKAITYFRNLPISLSTQTRPPARMHVCAHGRSLARSCMRVYNFKHTCTEMFDRCAQMHAHTHVLTHARTHARTHACTHAITHAREHT